jgi:hypothetical protein
LRLRVASVFRSIRFAMRYTLYRLSILRAGSSGYDIAVRWEPSGILC